MDWGSARASRIKASPARAFGAVAETNFDFRLDWIIQFAGQSALVEQFQPIGLSPWRNARCFRSSAAQTKDWNAKIKPK
jgi:hypothetical protein